MKCSACNEGLCYGEYSNRDRCTGRREGIQCTCLCHITTSQNVGESVAFGFAGSALFACEKKNVCQYLKI